MASAGPAPDAIVRVLFACPKAHIYAVPPLTSSTGYMAAQWTTQPAIFTARVRITETAAPASSKASGTGAAEALAVAVLLEDGASGELFAAAPYTHPSVVTPCMDSSRFFALRVAGDGGRKATLGLGFEERGDAFEFGVALQGVGRVLGFVAGAGAAAKDGKGRQEQQQPPPRDLSLKEGEMVRVDIGRRKNAREDLGAGRSDGDGPSAEGRGALFEIKPPPSAADVKRERLAQEQRIKKTEELTAKQLGFDDGEFGEFQ